MRRPLISTSAVLAGSLTLLCLAACAVKPAAPVPAAVTQTPAAVATPAPYVTAEPAPPSAQNWDEHVKQFEAVYFSTHPVFAVMEGRHEYDGRLPDWSEAALQQQIQWLNAQRTATQAYTDDMLTAQQQFERDYVLARIDGDLFWLVDADQPHRNPSFYTGALDPGVYLTRPYAPLAQRMQAFIVYAKAVPAAAAQIRANLQMPMPKTFVTLGVNGFGGFADFYRKDVPAVFADVKDATLQQQLTTALDGAAAAMDGLVAWLKSEAPTADDNFALGPERFAKMLYATERVDTPLAKLVAIGRTDLLRNMKALKRACAQYAPEYARGQNVKDCVRKVNLEKPEQGPVAAAREQLTMLRQFVLDKHLVSIPSDELALVHEAPPYKRSNSAYISIPGPYDKGMPSTYYIAPPDPDWSKADQDAYIPGQDNLLFISAHEVWPGHFLQFLHSNRSSFEFGRLFVGYAFAEGWAHYAEQMMWDAGLGNGAPDVHIGQLGNALLRDVRFLCAIGLHTQNMTVQTCENMFSKLAFQDPGNARQQAARGTYDPAYLNYTLGKLMIMKLRKDWTATHGGRAGWRDFHDQFLSYGGPPIPLVRAQMLDKADDGALF